MKKFTYGDKHTHFRFIIPQADAIVRAKIGVRLLFSGVQTEVRLKRQKEQRLGAPASSPAHIHDYQICLPKTLQVAAAL